jgi:hypothetical protein
MIKKMKEKGAMGVSQTEVGIIMCVALASLMRRSSSVRASVSE